MNEIELAYWKDKKSFKLRQNTLRLLLGATAILCYVLSSNIAVAESQCPDDVVSDDTVDTLCYANVAIKEAYYDGNHITDTVLSHQQSVSSADAEKIIESYKSFSTLTIPNMHADTNAVNIVGNVDIQNAFIGLFSNPLFEFGTVWTVTAISQFNNVVFQTWLTDTDCFGTDTFFIYGRTIHHQTAYVSCASGGETFPGISQVKQIKHRGFRWKKLWKN